MLRYYRQLLAAYGPQGWWPLLDHKGTNPTKTGSTIGYHPGDYSFPHSDAQRFEICVGAILTQNTAWPNVEKALRNLAANGLLSPRQIRDAPLPVLLEAIRPAGYFNQKARKLQIFSSAYLTWKDPPTRETLLSLWGIGPETADSMLLYAFRVPVFVVDAYTRRLLQSLGYAGFQGRYADIQAQCTQSLARVKEQERLMVFQEFHALIVEHAKRVARPKDRAPVGIMQDDCGRLFSSKP